jgi:hypothetical protein
VGAGRNIALGSGWRGVQERLYASLAWDFLKRTGYRLRGVAFGKGVDHFVHVVGLRSRVDAVIYEC